MPDSPDSAFEQQPFGARIAAVDVVDALGFFDDWEDRYRYVIDLGKQLAPMAAAARLDERLVKGCQSPVWLEHRLIGDRLYFLIESDAHIVRGLAAVVLAALNGRPPAEIAAFDIEAYFAQLDLIAHLSPTRGNGLRAMVERMRAAAQS